MKTITKKELAKILVKHKKWRDEFGEGEIADFSYVDLSGADLRMANLRYANFSGANLCGADLSNSNLRYGNLSNIDFSNANLSDADLSEAWFNNANLSGADLSDADMRGAIFSNANLSYANLRGAIFSNANLSGAILSNANFRGAVGNMCEVKSLSLDNYSVTYTSEVLQIGCECHLISDWWTFDDKAISKMDSDALAWWVRYKEFIKMAIEISPAVPTGHETSLRPATFEEYRI